MIPANRMPVALTADDLVTIPGEWCARVGHEWRHSPVPEFRAIARACDDVAEIRTDRLLRGSAAGTALTVDQAAVILRVSPGFVRRLLRSGDLEGRKTAGIWLVDRASVVDRRQRDRNRSVKGSRYPAAPGPGAGEGGPASGSGPGSGGACAPRLYDR